MKKIISLIAAAALLCGGAVMPTHGAGLEDYVPGEMNENLIPDSTAGSGFMYFGTRIGKAEYSDWNTATEGVSSAFKYSYTGTGDLVLTNNWGGFEGFFLNRNRGDGKGSFGFTPVAGKTYVFKANVKNASSGGVTPSFGIAVNGTFGPANVVATNEYGTDGMALSDEWKEFKGTISLPASFKDDTSYGCSPIVGFAAGAPEGSAFWLDVSEKDSVYFAEEQVYDITINKASEGNEMPQGSSANFKAEVVNQIGIPGNLKQNFVWNVFDEDRATIAKGFEVITDSSTQNTTIKVLDSASEGRYYVLAVSTDYTMVKTFEINVTEPDPFVEYTAGEKNANLIPDATNWKYLGSRNNGSIQNAEGGGSGSVTTSIKYYYAGTDDLALGSAWRGFEGFELNSVQLKDDQWFNTEAGKTYVISMNIKNVSSDGVTPYFGGAINGTYGPANLKYTNEYGAKGMAIEGSDWTKFNASITLPDNFTVQTDYGNSIFMGFPAGTKPGTAILIDRSTKESVYVAEEQLYDITAEIDNEPEAIRAGDTISLTAKVINQVESTGSLKQNFKWFAANAEKSDYADGFEFVKNGNSVSVKISDDIELGTYYIFAESTDYDGMRRAVKIDVQKALIGDKENISDDKTAAKKIIIESNSEDDVVEMTDEYTLKATVLNQEDLEGELTQDFNWYVINNDQSTIAENITIEKLDAQNAEVKIGLYAEPGEYYAVAEPVNYEGIRKIYKFTVDKATAKECVVELLNKSTAEALAENLTEYLEVIGLDEEYVTKTDAAALAELIVAESETEEFTADNLTENISKLAVISLYNKNTNNVELYNENGDFNYADALGLDEYFTETTLKNILDKTVSVEGRKAIHSALTNKNFKNAGEFFDTLAESIILKAIQYPEVLGTQYIEEILTEANAEKADINIEKYTSLKSKTNANKTLARNEYTKAKLESTISGFKDTTTGGGGTGSSSSKGSAVSGSVIINTPQTVPDTSDKQYDSFEDVDETYWAYDEIYHLKKLGIVSGVDEKHFNPEANITREQFIKLFIDAFEYSKVNNNLPYEDAVEGAWYYTYLATAREYGLINGISDTEFGVGAPITRQDICVIVMRAMKGDTEEGESASFVDFESVSDYAKSAVTYLSNYGVIKGFSDGSFMPKNNCTRAQAVKIICTLINLGGVAE